MYISTLLIVACLAIVASAATVNDFGAAEASLQISPAKAQYLLRPLYPGRWCLRCYPVGCWYPQFGWPFCRWYPWPFWHNSIVCRWQWCPIWRPTPTFIPIPTFPKIPEPDPVIRFHPEFDLPRLAGHLRLPSRVVLEEKVRDAPDVETRDVNVKGTAQTTVVFSNAGEFPGVRVARVLVGDADTEAQGLGLGFGFRVLGFIEFQDGGTGVGFDTSDTQIRTVLFASLGNWTQIQIREVNDGGVDVTGQSELRNAAGDLFASVVVKFTDDVDGKTRGAEEERAGPERVKFTLKLVKPHSVAGSSIAILGEVRHRSRVDDNSADSEAGLSALLIQPDSDEPTRTRAVEDNRQGFVSWDTTVLADGSVRKLSAQAHGNSPPTKIRIPSDGFTGTGELAVFLTFSVERSDSAPNEIVWDPAVGAVADTRDPGPTAPTPSLKPTVTLGPNRYVPAITPTPGRFRLWPLYPGRWCLRCYRIGCWWRWWSWPFCRRWPFPFGWNTIYCRWVWCPIFLVKPSLPIETAIPKPGDDVINPPVFDLPRFGGHFASTVAGRSVLEGQMEMRELSGEQHSLVVFSTGENFPTFRVARVNPNANGEAQGAGLGFGFRLLGFVEYVDQNEEGLDSADPITRTVYFNNVGANWTDIDVAVLGDSANYTVKSTLGAGPLAEVQVLFTDTFNDFGGDVSGPERAKFVLTLRNAFSAAGTRISVIGQLAHSSFVNDDSVGGEFNAVTVAPDEAAQSSQRSGFVSWQNNVLGDGSVVRLIPKSWGVIPPTGVAAPGDGFAQSETLVYLSFSLAGTAQPAVISWDPTTGVVADTTNPGPQNPQAQTGTSPAPVAGSSQSSGLTPAQIGGIVGGVVGFLILLLILCCILACIKKILCCAARSVTGKPKRMSSSTMYDAPVAGAAAPGYGSGSFQDSAGGYPPAYSGSGGYSGGYGTSGSGSAGGYGSASASDGAAATSGGYAAATSGGAGAAGSAGYSASGGGSAAGSASGGGAATLSGSASGGGYGSEGV